MTSNELKKILRMVMPIFIKIEKGVWCSMDAITKFKEKLIKLIK